MRNKKIIWISLIIIIVILILISIGLYIYRNQNTKIEFSSQEICALFNTSGSTIIDDIKFPVKCQLNIGDGFTDWKLIIPEKYDTYMTAEILDENNELVQKISTNDDFISFPNFLDLSLDINFDGYKDLQVINIVGSGNVSYDYWILNQKGRKFEKDPVLQNIANPEFDADKKIIKSSVIASSYKTDGATETIYEFVNGKYQVQTITPSVSSTDLKNWETYTSTEYGFEIKYPENFYVEETEIEGSPAIIFADKTWRNEFVHNPKLVISAIQTPLSAKDWLSKMGTEIDITNVNASSGYKYYGVNGKKDVLIGTDNIQTIQFNSSSVSDFSTFTLVQSPNNNLLLEIFSISSSLGNFPTMTYNKILSTFKFTK